MGVRVAAAWALIGLAAQCALALLTGLDFETGIKRAFGHWIAWGTAGFVLGTLVERAVEDSVHNFVHKKVQEASAAAEKESAAEESSSSAAEKEPAEGESP